MAGPLMLILARARRHPGRWLLPLSGIVVAVAFAAGIAAEGVIAGDQGARARLAGLSALERTVRVTWQGPVTPAVADRARGLLHGLGLGPETEVTLLGPVRLSGVVVRPAAISPLGRWLPGAPAAACRATSCPVVLAGGGRAPSVLSAAGVRLRVVGSEPLRSSVPLAFAPAIDGPWPVLVTGDVGGLDAVPGLGGVYRTHTWLAPLRTSRLHSWQLAALEQRLARAQASLDATSGQLSLTAPFDGLAAARSQSRAASKRLLLVGGAALASIVLFIVFAAGGLRIEQRAEVQRLLAAGARAGQATVFVVGEGAWICLIGLLIGAGAGIVAAAVLAGAAGEPVGGVLAHGLLTLPALIALAAGWVAATALMSAITLAHPGRLLDLLAIAAVSVLIAGLSLGSGSGRGWTLLLAPLCCLAAAVGLVRLAEPGLQALERLARRGPVTARLALVGLARAPGLPSLAIAFVAVSVGLGGFALAYRATLLRGAADQAADRVPLDALVSSGDGSTTPLELAPLPRWRSLARGPVLPVRTTTAIYPDGSSSATVPALGVPAEGLSLIHGWRSSYGRSSLSALARRLRPAGPARTPGPVVAAGTRRLSVAVDSPGLAVEVTADLRDARGAVRRVLSGAPLPPGRWELEALELSEPSGVEITNGHQNAENPAAATQSATRLTLGPVRELDASGRVIATVGIASWRGVGAAAVVRATPARAVRVRFQTSGIAGVIRPVQPTDAAPVAILADPRTAAAAGPGGRISMTIDDLPVNVRVVGVIRHFPSVPAGSAGFVVADQSLLSAALDSQLPGQGLADQLWIESPRPGALRAFLRTGPLSSLFRTDIERQLRDTPIARGVLRALVAAAAVSGALSVLGMLLALIGSLRDPHVERDLEEQGMGPRLLRTELRARFVLASALGAVAGFLIALLLTIVAVSSVSAAVGDPHPQPPLVTVVPWGELAAWTFGAVAILTLAGLLATARRPGRRRGKPATRAEPVPFSEAAAP